MSGTVAYSAMRELAAEWEKLYKSAVCSGIVGDAAHAARGGYHIGRKFQDKTNYSVVRPQDRAGNGPDDASAGIDMSMNTRDIVLCTTRLKRLFNNTSDPRRKYINAFNGWMGHGDATRYDIYARKTSYASPSHTWHIHLDVRRAYVLVPVAHRGILSGLAGESVDAYKMRIGVTASVPLGRKAEVAVPPWPGHVYKRNDSMRPDANVKRWQARMIARGWTTLGTADGIFGVKTEAVVRSFQKLARVQVDGQIGKQTWPLPWTIPI